MRVFVSSLIGGFEGERAAARSAITTLRHEAVMAEDFGAQPTSPQVACLQGLRSADLIILILGERYGPVQTSGLSATHEEYREAKDTKPILAFVQDSVSPDPDQEAFIREVQEWDGGLFRQSFSDSENLRILITRALHDYEITTTQAPVDPEELRQKAAEVLPDESRSSYSGSGAQLCVSMVPGPAQQIIHPAVMEEPEFADNLQQSAQFGSIRLFDTALATERAVESDVLVLRQERGASISVSEGGDLYFEVPLNSDSRRSRMSHMDASVIIEEDVSAVLRASLEFASNQLEEIDPTQRLSHIGMAVRIIGGEYRGWRTRTEHQASPNSVEIPMFGSNQREAVVLDFPRPGLRLNRNRIVEDVIVRLRRQWQGRR